MQQQVYQTKVRNVDKLKPQLIDVWHGFKQSVIDDAADEWRKRLPLRAPCQTRVFRALQVGSI